MATKFTDFSQGYTPQGMPIVLKAGDPVDIKLWTKNWEIQCWRNCIPLRYNFYQSTQQFKLLDSRQIRTARLVCILEVNGSYIFLLILSHSEYN